MKKLLIFLFLFMLVGCSSNINSPTGEVQKLFSNYNNLSSDVLIQLDTVMESENLNDEQIAKYKEILKRQYEDLQYKINDEIISQDNAIVSVSIEVYDLAGEINSSEEYLKNNREEFYVDNEFNNSKFWDYKLDKMLKTEKKVNYTIDFSLTKIDDNWVLDELLETDRQKIHGLYK